MATLDDKGFRRKMASLRQVGKSFTQLPVDATAFAGQKLANELLNLPENAIHPASATPGAGIIRRITGFLVRSISFRKDGEGIRLFMNESTAPYAQKVNDYSIRRYGKGYLELFLGFYSQFMTETMRKEVQQAVRDINAGRDYRYRNPFPVA